MPVDPNESRAGIHLAGRGIFRMRKAAVEMARHEEPLSLGIVMGKTAVKFWHTR
jgi:hypothetical protein